MKRAFLMVAVLLTACGSGTAVTRSLPTSTTASTTTSSTTTTTAPPVIDDAPQHFTTPEAAMTYLAAAWNTGDDVALRHVTDPSAREQLDAMHDEAVNLRLDHCDANETGDYTCTFLHDYPTGTTAAPGEHGQAFFLVGPADAPGWYMTVFIGCG